MQKLAGRYNKGLRYLVLGVYYTLQGALNGIY